MRTRNRIRDRLDDSGYKDIELEIIRDCIYYRVARMNSEHYRIQAGMGVSLGPKGSSESGTLGGYLNARNNRGETASFAVTNYHVVRSGLSNEERSTCDISGKIFPWHQKGPIVNQPTLTDHKDYMDRLGKKIQEFRKVLESKEAMLEEVNSKTETEVKPPGLGQRLEPLVQQLKHEIERQETTVRQAEEFSLENAEFGHVRAVSGFRRSPQGFLLDWALSSVNNSRAPGNSAIPTESMEDSWICSSTILLEPKAPVGINGQVWKKGQTTGVTHGTVNGIREVVMREGESISLKSQEWVIVSNRNGRFSEKGDSGSFIVDGGGYLIGLLHCGHLSLDLTYFTQYHVLVDDIKNTTGWEVVMGFQ